LKQLLTHILSIYYQNTGFFLKIKWSR